MISEVLKDENNGQHIHLKEGTTIQVDLEENPTTGYRWEVDHIDSAHLLKVSEDFIPAKTSGVGASGRKIFELRVRATGTGKLTLVNRQRWSGDVYKTFEVSY
jgi:inhibitor of cysteine peptidase